MSRKPTHDAPETVYKPTWKGSCIGCGRYPVEVDALLCADDKGEPRSMCTGCFREAIHAGEDTCSLCGENEPTPGHYLTAGRRSKHRSVCRECAESALWNGVPANRSQHEVNFDGN